jgi:hypothetical protein
VIKREGDDRRVEARVQRVEHSLAHRHAVMALKHRWRVGKQNRDGIAALDAALCQRRGKLPCAPVEIGI